MAIRRSLQRFADWLTARIAPGLEYSQHTFESRLNDQIRPGMTWLDVGCGHALLPEWREAPEREMVRRARAVVGIDMDIPALARHRSMTNLCGATASRLPFPDGTFDLATANMVVEHLDDPRVQFAEIGRVLKPGGLFIFHTPNAGNYLMPIVRLIPEWVKPTLARVLEGRREEDVYPTHYRANRPAAIEDAVKGTGLVVENIEFINSSATFSVVPPLLVFELLFLRQLQRRPSLARYRATIVCRLRKPASQSPAHVR